MDTTTQPAPEPPLANPEDRAALLDRLRWEREHTLPSRQPEPAPRPTDAELADAARISELVGHLVAVLADSGPHRIQRRRTAGWRMPDGALYVGRGTVWGNPYIVHPSRTEIPRSGQPRRWQISIADGGSTARSTLLARHYPTHSDARTSAVDLHLQWLNTYPGPLLMKYLAPLTGHDLACWCPIGDPCHANTLLGLANNL